MKSLILSGMFIFLNLFCSHAQNKFFSEEIRYSIHAKTSVLFSTIKGEYTKKEQKPSQRFGPSFGCFLSVAVNDQWAVEPGLFLSLKGSKAKIDNTSKINNDEITVFTTERGFEERDLYYLDLPLMISYRMESKLTIGIGMSGSVLLKSKYNQDLTTTVMVNNTVTTGTVSYQNSNIANFKRIDAGFLFSVGYMLKDGLEASANTYSGLVDIMHPDREFKNIGFGISLSYRFKQL